MSKKQNLKKENSKVKDLFTSWVIFFVLGGIIGSIGTTIFYKPQQDIQIPELDIKTLNALINFTTLNEFCEDKGFSSWGYLSQVYSRIECTKSEKQILPNNEEITQSKIKIFSLEEYYKWLVLQSTKN